MNHQYFIGIDRSDTTIDICTLNQASKTIKQAKINSSPESLQQWVNQLIQQLKEQETIALCIEQPCQNLVNFFSQFPQLVIYLENPSVIKKYRESLSPSRAKDDKRDAAAIAQYIFERHLRLEPYSDNDPLCSQIATLVEKRRQLVGIRTSLSNKLTQALKEYFPQALELIGKHIYSPLSCNFLTKWSSLQDLQKARSATVLKFYHIHNSRSTKRNESRMQLIEQAIPLCTDLELIETYKLLVESLVKNIQQIQSSINRFEQVIEEKSQQHEDFKLYINLPGAGPCFAARLLAFMGSDRDAYQSASAIQKNSGVAPVTKQSGKMHFVHRRYACNKFSRQTFVEWAGLTLSKSLWAKAFYLQQKAKGHRHQSILRSLAYKWQRILFRCWKNREHYDENKYIKALKKSSSPLSQVIENIKDQYPKLCEQIT